MENKAIGLVRTILWGLALILLLAAALDITAIPDNLMIFWALACFVVSAVLKRIAKGSTCCK